MHGSALGVGREKALGDPRVSQERVARALFLTAFYAA